MTRRTDLSWKAITLAILLFVATAGVAFAATLTLTGGHLGTGSVSTNCQSSTLTPSWVFTYNKNLATPGYQITGITLSGLEAGCLDRSVTVVISNVAAGTELTRGTGTTPAEGDSVTVTFATPFTMGTTWLRQITVVVYA